MLLPQELKKHEFSRAFRGYAADEVDEYIAFVVSKYEDLYRENDETGRKLSAAMKSLEELRAREAKIAALDTAIRKAAGQILAEAEQKRRQILSDAEEYADRIVAEANAHVASQENQFLRIQKEALAFRDALFAAYSSHIDQLEELAAAAAEEAFTDPLPAAALTEAAEEIAPPLSADTEETQPANGAEEKDAAFDTFQREDVYSDEELYDDSDEPTGAAEDDSDKYETTPPVTDEDVYSEEELADADLPDDATEAEIVMEFPDDAPEEDEETEKPTDADLFSALFAAEKSASRTEAEPEDEEIPWAVEAPEELEEIPADNSEDDALLRELHDVFSREFAALKTKSADEKASDTVFLPIEEAVSENTDDDDANLNELKKRMGITEETKNEKEIDFSFLPEDTAEEETQTHGLFGKNKQ